MTISSKNNHLNDIYKFIKEKGISTTPEIDGYLISFESISKVNILRDGVEILYLYPYMNIYKRLLIKSDNTYNFIFSIGGF